MALKNRTNDFRFVAPTSILGIFISEEIVLAQFRKSPTATTSSTAAYYIYVAC
jgi:hypothetical protein